MADTARATLRASRAPSKRAIERDVLADAMDEEVRSDSDDET